MVPTRIGCAGTRVPLEYSPRRLGNHELVAAHDWGENPAGGSCNAFMLNKLWNKSSSVPARSPRRRLPRYGLVGAAAIVIGEVLLFAGAPLVDQWFTPVMWTGYILLMDALVRRLRGSSLLGDHPREFAMLTAISIGSWTIFEGYNLLLRNWSYVGLPDNLVVRYIGYAWAFATISPGMFLTFEFLDLVLPGNRTPGAGRLPNGVFWLFVVVGLASLLLPLAKPSTHMTPLVWIGFAFLLDPVNGRLGERSFLTEFFTGRFRSMPIMFLAGLVCGFLWEFWNYWAASKWHYDVPYVGHIKLFEMPILGFFGFMPFAVESYAIYAFVRRLLPVERRVKYLGQGQNVEGSAAAG